MTMTGRPDLDRAVSRLRAALAVTAATVDETTLRPLTASRRPPRRWPGWLAPVAAAAAVLLIVLAESGAGHTTVRPQPAGPTVRLQPAGPTGAGPLVKVAGRPVSAALDPSAGTLYLGAGRAGLDLVDTAACNASSTRGCGHSVHLALPGRQEAVALALDERTRTLFVLSRRTSAVLVFSTTACTAASVHGCLASEAVVSLPAEPDALAISQRTGTLYVAYPDSAALTLIKAGTCTGADPQACAGALARAPMSAYAGAGAPIAVDPGSGTLYVGTATGMFLIDGRTCNITDISGCTTVLATVRVAGRPTAISAGSADGQVYVASAGTSQVTVLDRATCRAGNVTGCAGQPVVIRGGALPEDVLAVPQAGTLYVADAETNTVSMPGPAVCAPGSGACGQAPASFPAGTGPTALAADAAAHTLYVAGSGGTVSVINTATCNASGQRGCPARPPAGTAAPGAGRNPVYYCDPVIAGYQSGLPAGPLLRGSVRVAAGTAGGLRWSVWAKQGIPAPYGIEQGGLVLNGRWYALCGAPLSAGPGWNIQVIDTGGRGVVYGFIQHPQPVAISLTAGRPLRPPSSVLLKGTTFFIGQLPRSACAYPAIILRTRATAGPVWSGWTSLTLSGCTPGWLLGTSISGGVWGTGVHAYRPGPGPGALPPGHRIHRLPGGTAGRPPGTTAPPAAGA